MKKGILVISHGSREQAWVDQVDAIVAQAIEQFQATKQTNKEDSIPVYNAYFEIIEGRLIQDGITALEQEGVTHLYVMPLFISHGSSHIEEIKQAFGFAPVSDFIGDLDVFEKQAHISFDEPIVDDPEVIHIVTEQMLAMSSKQQSEAVLVLGHGSSYPYFFSLWENGMQKLVQKLEHNHDFQLITYAPLLPERSREKLEELLANREVERVLVVSLFISPGYFTAKVIPSRLSGLNYEYTGETLLPHPEMVKLLCRRFMRV